MVEDHPRVCGEKLVAFKALHPHLGSPPRMRGKDLLLMFGKNSNRITPAYAGKRPEGSLRNGSHWDHPRICGEKHWRDVCAS